MQRGEQCVRENSQKPTNPPPTNLKNKVEKLYGLTPLHHKCTQHGPGAVTSAVPPLSASKTSSMHC